MLIWKFLHIFCMIGAIALAYGPSPMLAWIAQCGDVRSIRNGFGAANRLAAAIPILFIAGAIFGVLAVVTSDGNFFKPWLIIAYVLFIIGMVEVALIVLTTTVWFGAEWGNLVTVTLVTALLVTCVMAIASLIAISARSPAQAQGLEFVVAVLLVSIGGHMVPYRNLPDFVGVVAQYTPNGAAIDAFASDPGTGSFSQASTVTRVG